MPLCVELERWELTISTPNWPSTFAEKNVETFRRIVVKETEYCDTKFRLHLVQSDLCGSSYLFPNNMLRLPRSHWTVFGDRNFCPQHHVSCACCANSHGWRFGAGRILYRKFLFVKTEAILKTTLFYLI